MPKSVKTAYKDAPHFCTITTIEWLDIFTHSGYFNFLKDSLNYCMKNKGLFLHEYVFMTNHIHFIASMKEGHALNDVLRDFKRYTTNEIRKALFHDQRTYLKNIAYKSFQRKGRGLRIWQDGSYPKLIQTSREYNNYANYIWNNPVKKKYVSRPEDWTFSSARQRLVGEPHKNGLVCSDLIVG